MSPPSGPLREPSLVGALSSQADPNLVSSRSQVRSIEEIQTALGRDPANALLQELFVNSCQEEMRVLTTVRDSGRQEL